MKKHVLSIFAAVFLVFGFSAAGARAQSGYSQEDLDAILAPIALYPDELLTQVLIASTYPEDVSDARRYLDRYPSLLQSSALLANQVSAMPWDDSVKSLAQFPSILAMLDDQPEWEDALGYAFLNQQADVMQTIQRLRLRAQRAGYLRSNDRQIVDIRGGIIFIVSARDNYFYVPYYDPYIVYGRWWWPNRPPYYWDPPPRYRPPGYALVNGFFFGVSIGIINSIFHPVRPDWRRHHVIIIGGTKPGSHWQWRPRPPRPGHPARPGRPNRPPVAKPILKPLPPRPLPGKPGIQPPRPGIPGKPGRPEIQPPKPGMPEVRPPRPGQPERPLPGRPGMRPETPTSPVTRPAPATPVTKPAPITPPVTGPAPARPVVAPPAVKPERPVLPVTRPTPVTRPAPVMRPAMPPEAKPETRTPPRRLERQRTPEDQNKDEKKDRRAPG
ncbi:MAG TPA: DUF3300 domain-containing protein [Rhizomicrobium sp.]|nr:DUF3300 domain-containing protein [Rhizomicrobium sp.]